MENKQKRKLISAIYKTITFFSIIAIGLVIYLEIDKINGKTNSILLETAQRIFVSEDHKDFIYLYKLAKVKYNFVSNNKKLFNTASIWEGVLSHGQYNG